MEIRDCNPFLAGGDRYSKSRPSYPAGLAASLAALAPGKGLAVDVGCGNGQLAVLLAPHFDQVIGIDPSQSQLDHAVMADNLSYLARQAEDTGLPDDSADLITVAQAAHWFDLDAFYREARRVSKPGAALALISYGVPYIEDAVNAVFHKGYWQDLHEFWPPERVHVETAYADLYFPFPLIDFPAQDCRRDMTVEQFIDYITTWSAYAAASARGERERFELFFDVLRSAWRGEAIKTVVWPISVIAGRIQK